MSKSRHRQHNHPAAQWNPPPLPPDTPSVFPPAQAVVSSCECTGLEARPVLSSSEAEQYTRLYRIHAQKPQGNIGKGNPNNDPHEIDFHRE